MGMVECTDCGEIVASLPFCGHCSASLQSERAGDKTELHDICIELRSTADPTDTLRNAEYCQRAFESWTISVEAGKPVQDLWREWPNRYGEILSRVKRLPSGSVKDYLTSAADKWHSSIQREQALYQMIDRWQAANDYLLDLEQLMRVFPDHGKQVQDQLSVIELERKLAALSLAMAAPFVSTWRACLTRHNH